MDKMEFEQGNPQEAPKRIEKKKKRHRWLRLGLVTVALVLAVLVAVLWDPTAFDGLRRSVIYASAQKDEAGCAKLYTYAAEKDSSFASLQGSLVQATNRRILLLGEDGQTRYNADVRFTRCAVYATADRAAVYDIGGTEIYVLDARGLVRQLTTEGEILSCTMNEKGALAVTINKSGYKAAVVVYNEKGEKIFAFNSSQRFLMTACVSDNGRQLAAVTLGQSEGEFTSNLVIYDLDSTEPILGGENSGKPVYDQGMVYDLGLVDDRWCAVGENGLLFLQTNGKGKTETAYYGFAGGYLRRCSLQADHFAALLLGRYKSGAQGRLVTVSSQGEVLGELEVDREVLSVTAAGRYVAVLYSDALTVYDQNLEVCAQLDDASAARVALMRADGSVVLAGADAASLYLP